MTITPPEPEDVARLQAVVRRDQSVFAALYDRVSPRTFWKTKPERRASGDETQA